MNLSSSAIFHIKTRVFLKCFVRGCSFESPNAQNNYQAERHNVHHDEHTITPCRYNRIFTKHLVFKVKPNLFLHCWRHNYFWFCHIDLLIIWTKKCHCSGKLQKLRHKNLVFLLLSRFFSTISILKCIVKWSQLICKIFTLYSCGIWTLLLRIPNAKDTEIRTK